MSKPESFKEMIPQLRLFADILSKGDFDSAREFLKVNRAKPIVWLRSAAKLAMLDDEVAEKFAAWMQTRDF